MTEIEFALKIILSVEGLLRLGQRVQFRGIDLFSQEKVGEFSQGEFLFQKKRRGVLQHKEWQCNKIIFPIAPLK